MFIGKGHRALYIWYVCTTSRRFPMRRRNNSNGTHESFLWFVVDSNRNRCRVDVEKIKRR